MILYRIIITVLIWCGQEDFERPRCAREQDAPKKQKQVPRLHLAEVLHNPMTRTNSKREHFRTPFCYWCGQEDFEHPRCARGKMRQKSKNGYLACILQRFCITPLLPPIAKGSTFVLPFAIGAVSDDKSEPNASSISAKVIVFVPSL